MKMQEVQERTPKLLEKLLPIWEDSVRATHLFLSEEEIRKIRKYVPDAMRGVDHLILAQNDADQPVAFMGIEKGRLEMLFLAPAERSKGLGKQLLRYGIRNYGIQEVTVNEQNPQAVGFYEHMGFETYKRTDYDEEGNPYPLLYMKLHREAPKAVIGTNSWGSAAYEKMIRGSVVDETTLKEAMQTAVRSGLLYVDSARDYGFGKGPKLIGKCCPGEIKISSKYTPFTKFKPGQVRDSIQKDLTDFGRKKIEIYWLHMPNDIPQYMEELIALYREGIIENIGVSNFNLQECKLAKEILDKAGTPLYGVQNHYSLIDREWEKNGLLAWCRENGVQFWAWAVLEEGVLTGPKQKGEKFAIMKAIYSRRRRKLNRLFALMKKAADRHDLTIPQVAIAFVANKGIVPICGCRRPYQVAELKSAAETKLSAAEMKKLEEVADALNVKVLGPDLFRFAVRKKQ